MSGHNWIYRGLKGLVQKCAASEITDGMFNMGCLAFVSVFLVTLGAALDQEVGYFFQKDPEGVSDKAYKAIYLIGKNKGIQDVTGMGFFHKPFTQLAVIQMYGSVNVEKVIKEYKKIENKDTEDAIDLSRDDLPLGKDYSLSIDKERILVVRNS